MDDPVIQTTIDQLQNKLVDIESRLSNLEQLIIKIILLTKTK